MFWMSFFLILSVFNLILVSFFVSFISFCLHYYYLGVIYFYFSLVFANFPFPFFIFIIFFIFLVLKLILLSSQGNIYHSLLRDFLVALYNNLPYLTLVNALTSIPNNEQYICYSIYEFLLMLLTT